MTDHVVESLLDLHRFLDEFDKQPELLFRGQREDLPLLPKIARAGLNLEVEPHVAERELLAHFTRTALPHLNRPLSSPWDWLALAQHHGLPTRLLDWSQNPLAALWFTVRKPAKATANGVLWAYKPTRGDFLAEPLPDHPFSVERTRVMRPNHVTARLVAQGGAFTVHAYFPEHGGFVPFEDSVLRGGDLQRVNIPASSFSRIRYELDRCGINASTMFPDLDGLCEQIQWLNTCVEDEHSTPASGERVAE